LIFPAVCRASLLLELEIGEQPEVVVVVEVEMPICSFEISF
jgi:hypothetical protein